MGNVLANAASWLNAKRAAFMSTPVVYRRGGQETILQATRGHSTFEIPTTDGSIIAVESQDFIVSWLSPSPQAGDRIVWGSGEMQEFFEVCPFGAEPCFRNSDEFGNAMRIHTKKVSG